MWGDLKKACHVRASGQNVSFMLVEQHRLHQNWVLVNKHKTFGGPGEVEVKHYLKHREFRVFCEKNQKVSECVSGGPRQNSAKLDPLQQWDFRKILKVNRLFTCIGPPRGPPSLRV